MIDVSTPTPVETAAHLNVANRLAAIAREIPSGIAVACPRKSSCNYPSNQKGRSRNRYSTTTFAELDADATQIAHGLAVWGVPRGTRLALLVRPGIEFVALVFGLLRAGMVIVLVDPGLGRRNLIRCLAEAEPEGFVAIGVAQAGRLWLRRRFPRARWNVTVGRRWFWGGMTLKQLRRTSETIGTRRLPATLRIRMIRRRSFLRRAVRGRRRACCTRNGCLIRRSPKFNRLTTFKPGGIDLACFPLFALFNSAMGVTTVLPAMDFSRPASADPAKLLAAANDWQVTQAFASPAVWRVLSAHCAKTGERIDSLRQVFSCGARCRQMCCGRRSLAWATMPRCTRPTARPSACPWRRLKRQRCSAKRRPERMKGRRVRRPQVRFDRVAGDSHYRRADCDN